MTKNELIEKGKELNNLHSEYKNADKPRDKKQKWQRYFTAAEEYRRDFAAYMKANPADISKLL